MRWLTRDLWKTSIAIGGMLLLLVLMVWVPVSAAGAHEGASGLAGPVTVTAQATPTANSTITAETANEQLRKLQRDNDRSWNAWFWNNGAALISSLALALAGILAIFRYFSDRSAERDRRKEEQDRWLKNQEAEREKRAEERFQFAVTGLGDEKEGAKIGAAILLRTFLRPDYKQFYTQTFDLAVANLRLRNPDPNTPEPPDTLRQALIVVFKEAFPLARSQNKGSPESLDATGIQLDNAYLRDADLIQVWIPQASLRKVDLDGAKLMGAKLGEAKLSESSLKRADLSRADLSRADLSRAKLILANLELADLSGADLTGADLSGAKLMRADLTGAKLTGAKLMLADLTEANLKLANLELADLTRANLTRAKLGGVNLESALSLKDTNLREVKLTKEGLETYKARGAIVDEEPTASSSQSTVSPPPPSQSNDPQAQPAPSAQGSVPTPDAGGSSAASSKPSPES